MDEPKITLALSVLIWVPIAKCCQYPFADFTDKAQSLIEFSRYAFCIQLRSSLVWDLVQCRSVVLSYRRFGPNYRSHLHRSSSPRRRLLDLWRWDR